MTPASLIRYLATALLFPAPWAHAQHYSYAGTCQGPSWSIGRGTTRINVETYGRYETPTGIILLNPANTSSKVYRWYADVEYSGRRLTVPLKSAPFKTPSFANLAAGDVIDVRYSDIACFYDATYEFSYSRGASNTMLCTQIRRSQGNLGPSPRKPLRTLTLTNDEIVGLDRLMAFYRCLPGRVPITRDTITLTHRRASRILATETFCYIGAADELERVVTFADLAKRASKND